MHKSIFPVEGEWQDSHGELDNVENSGLILHLWANMCKKFLGGAIRFVILPSLYKVYRGYIDLTFSVTIFVCLCVCL